MNKDKMKYEICPKCKKKGLKLIERNPIDMAISNHKLGDKECKYCGYNLKR